MLFLKERMKMLKMLRWQLNIDLRLQNSLRLTMEVANLEAFLEKRMSCSYEVMLSS
jgi:hypothetical protein